MLSDASMEEKDIQTTVTSVRGSDQLNGVSTIDSSSPHAAAAQVDSNAEKSNRETRTSSESQQYGKHSDSDTSNETHNIHAVHGDNAYGDEVEDDGLRKIPTMPPLPGAPMVEPVSTIPGQTEEDLAFPEGGLRAWMVVFGAWCAMMMTFGMVNAAGFIQAYITENELKGMTEMKISWIFSIYAFLFFFGGIQVGPIFDAYGLKYVLWPGCIGSVASVFFLSACQKYYQFILGYAVLGGFSASLVFSPAIGCIGHQFYRRRGLATGLAATGGAFGGIAFPLAMNRLVDEVGYGWTIRIIGFVILILAIGAVTTLRTRLPPNKDSGASIDLSAFKDSRLLLTTIGIFLIEWAIFVPVNYITTYALAHKVNTTLAYQVVAFLNTGSVFGRFLPGWVADVYGRFNTMIVTVIVCAITCFAMWLPAKDNVAAIIAFAVMFGFWSGTGICLTPVCVGQICKTEDYGKRYGTCYFVVSFAVLTGLPIAGAILERQNNNYDGLIIFSGMCYAVAAVFFVAARVAGAGWKLRRVY